ncbi:hypothetical protein HOF40_04475 [Candidatus Parcubacteria bacterium]|jgi:hypothetical protein|nr:hypothetical protein [Candidatus Parcubacteria bacterium]MBT3949319.1 hypothetical protein [Candidatus Parcubacteria bacterium]
MLGKKKPSKFERYQDPTGEFSNKRLKMAEWYVSHKILLRKIFIITMTSWSVVTISIGLFVWGKYLMFDYTRDEINISSIAQNYISQEQIKINAPKILNLKTQRIINSAPEKYDFLLAVQNPNERWIAEVRYMFTYGNGQTEVNEAIVLPGQTRNVAVYGHDLTRTPTNVSFRLVDTKWKRIDPHEIYYPFQHIEQRLQFTVDNVKFTPANRSQGTGSHLISFDVSNDSLFSYWEGTFNVIYKNGGQVVAFSPLQIEQFLSGQKRSVERASFMDRLEVDSIEIEPLINVFDLGAYMPLR